MSLVDRIMASSPEGAYAKRSSEFKVGFRAAFERRIEGKDVGLPYPLGMLRSTCCAAAASRNLHGTQRYLLKTT